MKPLSWGQHDSEIKKLVPSARIGTDFVSIEQQTLVNFPGDCGALILKNANTATKETLRKVVKVASHGGFSKIFATVVAATTTYYNLQDVIDAFKANKFIKVKHSKSNRNSYKDDIVFVKYITIPTVKQGLYNTSHGVHYVAHNPYRQYRKGLCSDRLSCVSLRDFLLGAFPDNNYSRVIYDVLQNQQKTLPIGDALREASCVGMAAINQDYAITLSTENADGFDLYYRIYRVGSIDKNTIRVDNKLFLQEIYDTKREWCPKHEVILNG